MILESHFWKVDLRKRAGTLRKFAKQKRWTESSHAKFEQTIMVGFYSIRKLIEAKKLSNTILKLQVPVKKYLGKGDGVHLLNCHKLDELYQLESGEAGTCNLMFTCNQIIHSYIFAPLCGDDLRVCGFMVSSDRERNQRAFEIQVSDVTTIFDLVGADYPNSGQSIDNPAKGDFDVSLEVVPPGQFSTNMPASMRAVLREIRQEAIEKSENRE
ncbi:MAG: hypothetical protein K8U57_10210 [Planctomycetes bacterium]|nr:hypothetical protein [Planctomycetota bacterium]